MRVVCVLLLCGVASARNDAETRVAGAIRSYVQLLAGYGGGSIESIRSIIVADLKDCSAKFSKSIRYQLDLGYKKKYGKSEAFLKCVSEMLASGGKAGIAKLFRRYKAESKRDGVRRGIAEALGDCGDPKALSTLLKVVHDKAPEVAAAATRGCASYARGAQGKVRKDAMRKLIDRYMKVSDDAAGKKPESREMRMYKAVDPVMKTTLSAFAKGEELDSALAWDAWWRDQATKKWED
ncbi:MAG: HEAT repeat domain-containing protein [Planctomycetota bacterium]|jgi:hypothetical protein